MEGRTVAISSLHPLQKRILKRLGYGDPKQFSALQGDAPSNKVSFHLEKLQENGLIEKTGDRYRLTADGTEALPYLEVPGTERPVTAVNLFLVSDSTVYLERVDETGGPDATTGYLRPPATRARKGADLQECGEELYTDRFDQDPPELSLQAVFESTTRFPNGAEHDQILFFMGAEVEETGERWYPPEEMTDDVLPGMQDVSTLLLQEDHVVHGTWDLTYSDGDIGLDRFEARQP